LLHVLGPNRLLVEFAVDPDGYEEMYWIEARRAHETMRRSCAGDGTPTTSAKR
jgi:hypothetical protein